MRDSSARTSRSASCAKAGRCTSSTTSSTGKRENLPAERDLSRAGHSRSEGSGPRRVDEARRARAPRRADGRAPQRRRIRCTTPSVNIVGSLNLLEAVRTRSPKTRVVFSSTGGALYGDQHDAAERRDDFTKDPESPYAVAKLAVEHYLAYYGRVHELDTRRDALRQRVRTAAGPARRGRRRRDLLRAHPRGAGRSRSSATASRRATTCTSATWRARCVAARPARCRRWACSMRARSTSAPGSARRSIDMADTCSMSAGAKRAARVRAAAARASSRSRVSTSARRERLLGWKPRVSLREGLAETLPLVRRATEQAATAGSRVMIRAPPGRRGGPVVGEGADPQRDARDAGRARHPRRAVAGELGDHVRRGARAVEGVARRDSVRCARSSVRRALESGVAGGEARAAQRRRSALLVRALQFVGDTRADRRPYGDSAARAAAATLTRLAGRDAAPRARRRGTVGARPAGPLSPWLATIGSASPLIGLLGTVLGVIRRSSASRRAARATSPRSRPAWRRRSSRRRRRSPSPFPRRSGTTSSPTG